MSHEQIGIANCEQARAHADRGHAKKRIGCSLHRIRQLHATDVVILRCTEHARLCIGFLGIVCGLRKNDFLTIEARFFGIYQTIEGRVFFFGDALAGVKNGIKSFSTVIGESFALLQACYVQPFVQQKI